MQPEKGSEVRAWLQKAADDLRGADIDLGADPPFIEDALFHCQQAAEKAMKAFLTLHDEVFRKTHDLDRWATACEAIDRSLTAALRPARDMTVFAWQFRYPGEPSVPSEQETRDYLAIARAAYHAILDRIPQEAWPG